MSEVSLEDNHRRSPFQCLFVGSYCGRSPAVFDGHGQVGAAGRPTTMTTGQEVEEEDDWYKVDVG